MRTAHPRRSTWLAAALLGAMTVTAAGGSPVQATDLVSPRDPGSSTCAPPPEVVIGPGGGGIGPRPGPGIPLPSTPVRPLPPGPGGDLIGPGAAKVAAGVLGERTRAVEVPASAARASGTLDRASQVAGTTGTWGAVSLTYKPIVKLKTTLTDPYWGKTMLERPVIKPTAFCVRYGRWVAGFEEATQQTRQGVRMLTGVTELDQGVLDATVNFGGPPSEQQRQAACTALVKMADDLNTVAGRKHVKVQEVGTPVRPRTATRHYIKAAVQAHEDVHVTHYRNRLVEPFKTFKDKVWEIQVDAQTKAEAVKAISEHVDYQAAEKEFETKVTEVGNAEEAHTHQPADFEKAEHKVVDPMVTTIAAYAKGLGCP